MYEYIYIYICILQVIDILYGEGSMKWKCSKEEKKKENYRNGSNDCSVRVCADCNTTKTPLWRSGPRGPKVIISFLIDES